MAEHKNTLIRIEEYEYRNIEIPPERWVFRPSIYAPVSEPTPNKEIKSLKLYIFDYYSNLKPGMVFAYNQEEAIAMIKEAGITGQPDKFYSSAKEIEIPSNPGFVRYTAGE